MEMKKIFISTFPFSRSSPEPMRLLIESGYVFTLNPLGRKLSRQELLQYGGDADAIIAGTEDLSLLVQESTKLKIIARVGIGLDSVPLKECQEKGITVCYTPDAVTDAVSELTLGLMINLTRKIGLADRETRLGKWSRLEGKSLKEMTIGLVGLGRIGKRVAETLTAFRVQKILACDILDKSMEIKTLKEKGVSVVQVPLDVIVSDSDLISLHLPRTSKSENIFSQDRLEKMKKGAMIVNTARGGLIDEPSLNRLLLTGALGGAALDVFSNEPYSGELAKNENIILTQHMGSCSFEARNRMESEALEDVLHFLRGQPLRNAVNTKEELERLL